jgi:hypothetical protein
VGGSTSDRNSYRRGSSRGRRRRRRRRRRRKRKGYQSQLYQPIGP